MVRKNSAKSRRNSTKQAPSATGARLTRLTQAFIALAAVKLAAICLLWIPPTLPESPLLQPVVIRPAIAATQALAQEPVASPAEGQDNASESETQTNPQDLNAREQALAKKEAELRDLEAQVDEKLTRLRELEIRMQNLIDSAGSIQDEKMAHLIDVYSNMKPKQAAVVLQTLEEPIAVRILAGMSGRKAGEILSSVRADRAAELSAALTRLQTGENGN
jgi:flagellar motility protein MotE (MotC chaperone)